MSASNQTTSIGSFNGVQALVVDNDRDTQYLYAALLEGCGANVITVGSVKEAVDVLAWFPSNLLLCEMRFLGESLDTLITALSVRENNGSAHIPSLVITTQTIDSFTQMVTAGFDGFLLKPITLTA